MKKAVTTTYYECEPMLYKICHKFSRVYGFQVEELMAEARYAFSCVYKKWDPKKGASFSTYLYFMTTRRLIDYCAEEISRKTDEPCIEVTENSLGSESVPFGVRDDLMKELSIDAAIVARTVLDLPLEFVMLVKMRRPTTRRDYRAVIQEYFAEDLGWGRDRVKGAFDALRAAFSPDSEDPPSPSREEMKQAIHDTWLLNSVGITPSRVCELLTPLINDAVEAR